MCNTCNTSFGSNRSGCNCGCNSCTNSLWNLFSGNSCGCNNGCGCNSWGNWGFQRICRDCNGNIRVRNSCGCSGNTWNWDGCNSCCNGNTWNWNNGCNSCCNGCDNNNDASVFFTRSGNGNVRCVSFCNTNNTSNTSDTSNTSNRSSGCIDGNAFFARQFGLTSGRSGRSSCNCGCND